MNDYPTNEPPCSLNRDHGLIGYYDTNQVSVIPNREWTARSLHVYNISWVRL